MTDTRFAAVIDAALHPQQVTENAVQVFSRSAHYPPLGVSGCIYRGGESCAILVATCDLMNDTRFEKASRGN